MQTVAAHRLCCSPHVMQQSQKRRRLLVHAAMPGGPQFPAQVRASRVPGPEEDKEVAHSAFLNAYGKSHHSPRIQGMQEFAGALLARQRIPSGQYADPLSHIFAEFDTDRDGLLTAREVAEALRSRQVEITDEQAELFVDVVDLERKAISSAEFRDLILHMAAADLHIRRAEHDAQEQGEWLESSWEQDEQIVDRLKSWTDSLMLRRFK